MMINSILESRAINNFANKDPYSQNYVFSSYHVYTDSWTIKKAEHWRTDDFKLVLEKTLESPLGSKEIKSVNPKGNQSWTFIGRTDAEAEAPILLSPDVSSLLIGKDPDSGND